MHIGVVGTGYVGLVVWAQQVEVVGQAGTAVDAVLVLDVSASVRGERLAAFRQAAHRFVDALGPTDSVTLLEFASEHIAPTAIALPVALSIQALIRRCMCQRNPIKASEQRRCNMIGVAPGMAKIRETPRLDAAGGTLEGMTGMGKTTIAHPP